MKDKDNNVRNEMLLSDTPVPDVFIVCHMHELSSDALKLYLWLMMNYGVNRVFEQESLKEYSYLNTSESSTALAEMLARDLVARKGSDGFYLLDLKQREAMEYARAYAARGVDTEGLGLSPDNKGRDVLAESISKTFYLGRCPYWCYRLIDKCLYEYSFDAPVVYKLFEEGRDQKFHTYYSRMEALAKDWYNHGYTSTNRLGGFYERKSRLNSVMKTMGRLTRRRLNGLDIERIQKWVDAMDVSPELAEYAFKCNEFRGDVKLKNVEDTLIVWHEAGISTVDKAMVYENERHTERKSKVRRIRGRDNLMKTGAEAGLLGNEDGKDKGGNKTSDKEDTTNEDTASDVSDVILDLFGGDDEDDK